MYVVSGLHFQVELCLAPDVTYITIIFVNSGLIKFFKVNTIFQIVLSFLYSLFSMSFYLCVLSQTQKP